MPAAGERSGSSAPQHFALFYDVVNDFVSRRSAHREAHLRLVREALRRRELLMAGALTDPVDRALVVFRAPDRSCGGNVRLA